MKSDNKPAAAPGITAEWVIGYLLNTWPEEVGTAVRNAFVEHAELNPTHTAPGIDVDLLEAAEDFISRHSYAWNGEGSHPNTIITGLRTLIDASPKGGSDALEAVTDALRSAEGLAACCMAVDGYSRREVEDIARATAPEIASAIKIMKRIQATSAEVGP